MYIRDVVFFGCAALSSLTCMAFTPPQMVARTTRSASEKSSPLILAESSRGERDHEFRSTASLNAHSIVAGSALSIALLFGSLPPPVALAAGPSAPSAPSAAKVVSIPTEKQAVLDAKAALDAATKRVEVSRKEASLAQAAVKTSEGVLKQANLEAKKSKSAFLAANDQLAAAKSSKEKDTKKIDSLKQKVAQTREAEKAASASLKEASVKLQAAVARQKSAISALSSAEASKASAEAKSVEVQKKYESYLVKKEEADKKEREEKRILAEKEKKLQTEQKKREAARLKEEAVRKAKEAQERAKKIAEAEKRIKELEASKKSAIDLALSSQKAAAATEKELAAQLKQLAALKAGNK